jgi:putative oxidoreductase
MHLPDTSLSRAQDAFLLLARVFIAMLFIPEGWAKVVNFEGTVGYIEASHMPLPQLAAAAAIGAELGLGVLLLVGWQARWAALGLVVFVAVLTPVFHDFWNVEGGRRALQHAMFFKNVAIAGGLLALAACGPGRYSADGRRVTSS